MKNYIFTIAALCLMAISFTSCEPEQSKEELQELEVLSTEHGESTNSNGGGNEDPDNGEG